MSRKHKPLPPRHKRLNRRGRLQAAEAWLRAYPGKNIPRGYRKHFGVDSLCAIRELRLLGVAIDPVYEKAVLAALNARKKKIKCKDEFLMSEESYFGFAYIAGFTAGGAPYGVTLEEAEALAVMDFSFSDERLPGSDEDIRFDDEIPF